VSDEAQAVPGPQQPDPPVVGPREPEAFEFSVEFGFDATVDVDGRNWIKPSARTKKTWRIRDGMLPSRQELELTSEYMKAGVLEPVISEMIDLIYRRVAEAQTNR
jgi:hypothetical protein